MSCILRIPTLSCICLNDVSICFVVDRSSGEEAPGRDGDAVVDVHGREQGHVAAFLQYSLHEVTNARTMPLPTQRILTVAI